LARFDGRVPAAEVLGPGSMVQPRPPLDAAPILE
jgi:hypothetical protein